MFSGLEPSDDRIKGMHVTGLSQPHACGHPTGCRRTLALAAMGIALSAFAMAPAGSPAFAQQAATKPAPANTGAKPPASKTAGSKASSSPVRRASKANKSIVVLVNDEPITRYEVQKRREMMALQGNLQGHVKKHFDKMIKDPKTSARLKEILQETVKANQGKSKDEIIEIFNKRKSAYAKKLQQRAIAKARATVMPPEKEALDALIDERLKIQEAKRLNVMATDEQVNQMLGKLAKQNKMTTKQFAQHLKGAGASLSVMKQRFRASMSWSNVIRMRFGRQVTVANSDIDRMVATADGEDEVELHLKRILLALPNKADEKVLAKRLHEAESLRASFSDCKGASRLANGVREARFQDLGTRRSATVPEPTRSLLLVAEKDEMLPPTLGDGGVELWAVCGRKTIAADKVMRDEAQNKLRQKEFEILAQRHLKDLRQDAHIEYR